MEESIIVSECPFLAVALAESMLQSSLLLRHNPKLKCLGLGINLLLRNGGLLLAKGEHV